MEEAAYHGKQSPGPQYAVVQLDRVKKRSTAAKIFDLHRDKQDKAEQFKIKKNDSVSPASYKAMQSYQNT